MNKFAALLWVSAAVPFVGGCSEANPDLHGTVLDADPFAPRSDGGTLTLPPGVLPPLDDAGATVETPDLAGIDGGPDLSQATSGCQKNATGTLNWYLQHNLQAQSSGALTVTVPDGILLHGTVSLPSLPANATFSAGLIQGTDTVAQDVFKTHDVTPTPDGKGFTYSLVVPPGTYTMQNRFTVSLPGGALLNRYSKDSATVCSATTHDMLLPTFPALTNAAVTVQDLRTFGVPVDPTQPITATVYFENMDHTFLASAPATINTTTGVGSATIPVTSETLLPSVDVNDPDKTTDPVAGGFDATFTLPMMPAASSYALTLPALVKLTGTLTSTTGLLPVANPAQLFCVSTPTHNFFYDYDDATVVTTGPYKTFYRKDGQCDLSGSFEVALAATGTDNANDGGELYVPLAAATVTLSADRTSNLNPPALGAKIALAGTLLDARGATLPGRVIIASSTSLTNVPNGTLEVYVLSDAAGHFTLNLLPGTYDLQITSYTK